MWWCDWSRPREVPADAGFYFVGAEEIKIHPAAAILPATGILTVGEADNKVSSNAVITFVIESGKVHFTINLAAAGRENLRVSSRLLGLASNVSR